jgi:hypothetical protein
MSMSTYIRKFKVGNIATNFELMALGIYHKKVNQKVFERRVNVFTEYAVKVYKELGYVVSISPIKFKDITGYELNYKAREWFKKVIPAIYKVLYEEEDIKNILSKVDDFRTKRRTINIFMPFLQQFVNDMFKGKPVNMSFILDFQRIIFSLLNEEKKFKDNVLDNYLTLEKLISQYKAEVKEIEEFKGIKYGISPQKIDFDILYIDSDDVLTIADVLTHEGEPDNLIVIGHPNKLDDIINQPCIVLPVSLLGQDEINTLLKKFTSCNSEDRKRFLRLLRSTFIKKYLWNVLLTGDYPKFFVTKIASKMVEWIK